MRQYWLQRYNATVPCYLQSSQSAIPSRSKLTMAKMSSAFIGLGGGLLMGLIVWIGEMIIWVVRLKSRSHKRVCEEVSDHLKRALQGSCRYDSYRRKSLDEALISQVRTSFEVLNTNGGKGTGHMKQPLSHFHKVTAL
ncbi:unnamed protein product [Dicrocoelium dendriticum]|nr:unnamed protein product [Dicrocoelium dendriticum]